LFCAAGMVRVGATAGDAASPLIVPELIGGISPRAVFRSTGFFAAARACSTKYPFGEFQAAAQAHQQDCLADFMKRHGATPQAIAFMRAAPVPTAIAAVREYGATALVYASMLWADGSDGWAIVGKSGVLVPLWYPPAIANDPRYRAFVRAHPGALLWSDRIDWPPADLTANGAALPFVFSLKVCRACATLGTASVVYSFDRAGHYRGVRLRRIAAA
jgi:hypothetical protein